MLQHNYIPTTLSLDTSTKTGGFNPPLSTHHRKNVKQNVTQGDYMATSDGIGHDVKFPLPNGLRHGRGRRVWANGATYDGRWDSRHNTSSSDLKHVFFFRE